MLNFRDKKISIGTIITVGSVLGIVVYVYSVVDLARKVLVDYNIRVHKIDLSGITLAADLTIINPTNSFIDFQDPFLAVFTSENSRLPMVSTNPSDRNYTIVKNNKTVLPGIKIFIPMSKLTSYVLKLIQDKSTQLDLVVNVKTKVKLKYGIPVSVDKKVPLSIKIPSIIVNNLNFSNEQSAAYAEIEKNISRNEAVNTL